MAKGRPGKNPTKTEVRLRGQLNKLLAIAKDLEAAKQLLETEMSTVLETLWNSHIDLHKRLGIIETNLGIEEQPTNATDENEVTDSPNDGSAEVSESPDRDGEADVHTGTQKEESEEVSGQEGPSSS